MEHSIVHAPAPCNTLCCSPSWRCASKVWLAQGCRFMGLSLADPEIDQPDFCSSTGAQGSGLPWTIPQSTSYGDALEQPPTRPARRRDLSELLRSISSLRPQPSLGSIFARSIAGVTRHAAHTSGVRNSDRMAPSCSARVAMAARSQQSPSAPWRMSFAQCARGGGGGLLHWCGQRRRRMSWVRRPTVRSPESPTARPPRPPGRPASRPHDRPTAYPLNRLAAWPTTCPTDRPIAGGSILCPRRDTCLAICFCFLSWPPERLLIHCRRCTTSQATCPHVVRPDVAGEGP